jgi:hypothetical protein
VQLNRLLVGLLAGAGATDLAGMPVLTVTVPAGVDPAEVLLTARLAQEFGLPLHAAIGIRPPDPHHKPTLQLFDDRGRPYGYAKVGWNDGTRAMARAEAAALSRKPRAAAAMPAMPRLMRAIEWQDRAVTVVEPMPRGVRSLRRPDVPRLAAMLAVARNGRGRTHPKALAGSAYLSSLGERATDPVRAALDALVLRHGATEVEFGDWHGDWVPWNLGTVGGALVAWDWENRGSDVPVGFDLAHQAFQTALSVRRRPVAQCAAAMDTALSRYGAQLGLGPAQQRLVGDAYLIELWLRTAELAAGGAGWNTALHPALLQVLGERNAAMQGAGA